MRLNRSQFARSTFADHLSNQIINEHQDNIVSLVAPIKESQLIQFFHGKTPKTDEILGSETVAKGAILLLTPYLVE